MTFFFSSFVTYFNNYYSIFTFFICSLAVAVMFYLVSLFFSFSLIGSESEKISTYECGFIPFGDARMKFDVSFYIISILFVIFDLEIVFLFPWSTCFLSFGLLGQVSMLFFFIVLTIGFLFEWSKGALEI
jgi:NADH-quinone oxidoreductase subunit A